LAHLKVLLILLKATRARKITSKPVAFIAPPGTLFDWRDNKWLQNGAGWMYQQCSKGGKASGKRHFENMTGPFQRPDTTEFRTWCSAKGIKWNETTAYHVNNSFVETPIFPTDWPLLAS
jgi:hypothetical protein